MNDIESCNFQQILHFRKIVIMQMMHFFELDGLLLVFKVNTGIIYSYVLLYEVKAGFRYANNFTILILFAQYFYRRIVSRNRIPIPVIEDEYAIFFQQSVNIAEGFQLV